MCRITAENVVREAGSDPVRQEASNPAFRKMFGYAEKVLAGKPIDELLVGEELYAHAAAQDQRRCEEAGMDGYVSKSIRPEFLRNEIERVTGGDMGERPAETAVDQPRQFDWDLKELMERLGGDEEFLRELLVLFREDARMNLEKSRKAMAELDFESLTRTAHTLKGMLRNLSMGVAAETSAALENASREKRQADSEQLLGKLVKELEGILPEVEAQLAGVRL